MKNPFETIDKRLSNIEKILLNLEHQPKEDFSNKRYSIKEAAEKFGVIPLTIRNHIKKGNLKAERFGHKYYILHSELYNALNEVKSLKYKR